MTGFSQVFVKSTLKANREKMVQNLLQHSINENLSQALTDSTEADWQSAFTALEFLQYQSPWVTERIDQACEELGTRTIPFECALLQLLHGNYPNRYYAQVRSLLTQTADVKVFAMSASYILKTPLGATDIPFLLEKTKQISAQNPNNPVLEQLLFDINTYLQPYAIPNIAGLFKPYYLPGQVLVLSFQRKNRDFPGLVLVRDTNGNVIRRPDNQYFSVPQLARSSNNMPGYISNGNTPEGIFRMQGTDVSRNGFIGPTGNVQLTMPFEKTPAHFYADSTKKDTTWDLNDYRKLIAEGLKDYYPMYQSYYSGKSGRTEIIIHGTTINPSYYIGRPFYPLTPTMGCLSSKEIWNEQTGFLMESDQQKLIEAIKTAGGAKGYVIVINLSDEERPVELKDILTFMESARDK